MSSLQTAKQHDHYHSNIIIIAGLISQYSSRGHLVYAGVLQGSAHQRYTGRGYDHIDT